MKSVRFEFRWVVGAALLACGLAGMAGSATANTPTKSAAAKASAVDWVDAATVADVQRAQATAKKANKPVFLYWGAVWCPPCNQVKATLFNRADFAALSKSFVMVRVDGDKPSAQQVAQTFKVRGYPSMLVLGADGSEITRLPGEADPERYLATMDLALKSAVPVPALVKSARVGGAITPEQWQQLAWYAWDIDEQQVAGSDDMQAALTALAKFAPEGAVRDRLQMRAWVATARDPKANSDAAWQSNVRTALSALLAAPARASAMPDLWMGYSDTLLKAIAPQPGADRDALAAALDRNLAAMLAGNKLSRAEQLDAWGMRLSVAELSSVGMKPLAQAAIAASQSVAAATPDKYERQAVIPTAAHVIAKAGDAAASDAMLNAELAKAVAPYYHMLVLGSNAKKRKDFPAALGWYEKAWTTSQGVATRAQWGSGYVNQLIDMAPTESAKVEASAKKIIAEAVKKDVFYARTQRSVQRMASKVQNWAGADPQRIAVAQRLDASAKQQCKTLGGQADAQKACDGLRFAPI